LYGSLTPTGQDPATVQTVYRILVASGVASPTPAAAVPVQATETPSAAARPMPELTDSLSRQLSILPILGAVVGLFAALVVLAVSSLRRRLRDELDTPEETEGPEPVGEIAVG
jgi:hypothetical protein